jgi:uncharacterized membrane protein
MYSKYEAWLLTKILASGSASLMKLLYAHGLPWKALSIGSYPPLHMSLPGLIAVIFFLSTLSSYAVFSIYLAKQ